MIASGIERLATEIRHLQRTEVREAEEFFHPGQKGSSAMPHKRNPVLSENLTGLARLVRAAATPALENVTLWHERDISHSSVERGIGPDATVTLDFALARLTGMMDKLLVYPDRMLANLESLGGVVHSGEVLLALARAGISREDAYRSSSATRWRPGPRWASPATAAFATTWPPIRRSPAGSIRRAGRQHGSRLHLGSLDHIFTAVFGEPGPTAPSSCGGPRAGESCSAHTPPHVHGESLPSAPIRRLAAAARSQQGREAGPALAAAGVSLARAAGRPCRP